MNSLSKVLALLLGGTLAFSSPMLLAKQLYSKFDEMNIRENYQKTMETVKSVRSTYYDDFNLLFDVIEPYYDMDKKVDEIMKGE